jgi:hypothetical protein
MDHQGTNRKCRSMMLSVSRILAAAMLVFGVMSAVAALNLGDSQKGHMPVNWAGFYFSSTTAVAGVIALLFVEPQVRRGGSISLKVKIVCWAVGIFWLMIVLTAMIPVPLEKNFPHASLPVALISHAR